MKKKVTYLFGTIISLIASIFSSATASACGGGAEYIPPKAYKDEKSYSDEKTNMETLTNTQVYTSKNGKSSVVVTSRPSNKSSMASKILLDGMAIPAASTKENKSEKERILKAIKEMGCFMIKNPDFQKSEEKLKNILKKYGFKTDDASMNALEAKYENDVSFMSDVEKAAKSCGG